MAGTARPSVRVAARTQLVRYALIGASNVVIDLGLLTVMTRLTGVHRGPLLLLLATASFTCALVNSYLLNARWAFGVSLDPRRQFPPFVAVNVVNLFFNDLIIWLLTSLPHPWLGPASPTLRVVEAKAVAIVATSLSNFLAFRHIVFAPETGGVRRLLAVGWWRHAER